MNTFRSFRICFVFRRNIKELALKAVGKHQLFFASSIEEFSLLLQRGIFQHSPPFDLVVTEIFMCRSARDQTAYHWGWQAKRLYDSFGITHELCLPKDWPCADDLRRRIFDVLPVLTAHPL